MQTKQPPRGSYALTGCSIARAEERTKKAFTFGIFSPTRKTLYLQADGEDDQIGWIKFIERNCFGVEENVSLVDFELLNLLGKGGFAKVLQVRKRDSGRIYAMKVLRKARVIESKSVASTKAEHKILKSVNHPFIVRMHFAFSNAERLFFVMEFVNGGELFTLLQRERRFKVTRARMYSAQLLLALEHLHAVGVIYRDLKPENILVDMQGCLKLTDFGLAKDCHCDERHYSMVGTSYYMAPEVIQKTGHTRAADWWSFGILLYEMLTGLPPFYDPNPKISAAKIVSQDVVPPGFLNEVASDCLRKLLDRDQATRLGAGEEDSLEIRRHGFYNGLDFNAVLSRRILPDYRPNIRDSVDVSNFDPRFTQDNPELSKAADRGDPDNVFEGFEFDYVAPPQGRQTVVRQRQTITRPKDGEDPEWDELMLESSGVGGAR